MSNIYQSFLANEGAIKRVFLRYFGLSKDVEDLTQETFVKCFAAETCTDIHDPRSFLFRVAKNLAMSERKKKIRTTTDSIEELGGAESLIDGGCAPADMDIDSKRKLSILVEAVANLPEDYRKAFLLRKVDNLKLTQIAERTNVTVRTAQKRVAVALDMCDAHLRAKGYDTADTNSLPAYLEMSDFQPLKRRGAND